MSASSLNLARTRSTSAGRDGLPSARPARPPLQNRTYSAPVGKLHLQAGRSGKQDAAGFTAIAENEATMTGQEPEDKEKEKDSSEEAATSGHQLPQVNLAVVGAAGVGKSTFVKCALDLKQTPLVRSSIKKMSMDGAIYVVRLLEIAIHKITLDDRGRIVWPKCLGEQALPPIDGVLCLFDSTDLRSVSQYPQVLVSAAGTTAERTEILDALRKSTNIPFLVIACKCDGPQNESQQDPLTLVQACRSLLGLKVQRISASHPESHKKCISTILRAIIMRSAGMSSPLSSSPTFTFSSSPALLVDCLSRPFCVCVSGKKKRNKHPSLWTVLDPVFPLSPIHHEPDTAWKVNIPTKGRLPLPLPARPPFVLAPLGAFAASSPLSITLNSLPAFSTHASHRPKRKEKKKKSEDEERRRGRRRRTLRYPPALAPMNSSLPARVEPLVLLLVFFFLFFTLSIPPCSGCGRLFHHLPFLLQA
ncbi:uncharacterized protein ARB_01373 [Trichophyton benhamiae CBS 112371]|uniref:Uncharacterized protein n=1 Tax=Arthroderma benhamiae (strain ATCC MYA-4681 / CBS 112371) TaxID=663331 RepID=D4AYV4_ARTBC|nr:uncharacterized protein ARB_01373 [Trichophyton benhamiae CBS 112371]EFE31774.1 hypothetical protein ARB_01373 [Trichophyton benhamiae CBS 112371]